MLARTSVARRLFVVSKRYSSGRVDGSVAQSKEFSKKEQAHENEYIRRSEQAKLNKLKEQIEAKKAELARLEAEHETAKNGSQ